MAEDFRELRARITVEADAVLDAKARVLDKERSEIVRDVMHRWALEEIRISKLIQQRLKAAGVSVASEGGCAACEGGTDNERDGSRR